MNEKGSGRGIGLLLIIIGVIMALIAFMIARRSKANGNGGGSSPPFWEGWIFPPIQETWAVAVRNAKTGEPLLVDVQLDINRGTTDGGMPGIAGFISPDLWPGAPYQYGTPIIVRVYDRATNERIYYQSHTVMPETPQPVIICDVNI